MKKINTFALMIILAICVALPTNALAAGDARSYVSGSTLRQQTTTNQAVATNCSQSASGVYSEKASFNIPTPLGSSWSAAFQVVAFALGQLNANAAGRIKAEMYCEQ